MKDYSGVEFLDKLYQNLYMSDEVQHTKENKDNRKEAIQKYMDRLERIHKNADTESKKELLYSLYFDKYVIKEEDLPYGVDKDAIINGQKKSLAMWLEYLSNSTANYPTWAKYWAFQGMLKMGSYDESRELYLKRNKKTIAPFVSANPEIIAKSIETISKLVKGEEVTTDTLEKLSKTDSFNKIYSLFEKKYKENIVDKSSTEGIWIKYNQGNKEDAIKLSKSLENKNTGWCTASEDMAIKQVCGPYEETSDGGDFYVYYTKDKYGKYTIPRIAIRLNGTNSIGEIRGIEDGQNLEEKMTDVLEEKLKEMSFLREEDIEEYLEKTEGLKELTRIGKKTESNEELTEEEINDLYERKYGFGWTQDPRVKKIQEKRNTMDDYNKLKDKKIKVKFLTYGILPKGTQINDKEIILEAVKNNCSALEYASKELRNDKAFILEAVKTNHFSVLHVDKEFIKDKEILLESIRDGNNKTYFNVEYDYIPEELRKDRFFMLEAVKRHYYVLEYASEELKNDKEIVLEAVKKDNRALQYASEELRNDKAFILEAVKINAYAVRYVEKKFKKDVEIALEAVKKYWDSLRFISKEIRTDKKIVSAALAQTSEALKYFPEELCKEILEAQEEIIKNPEIIIKIAKTNNISEITKANLYYLIMDFIEISKSEKIQTLREFKESKEINERKKI